ncbi:hypothetical protein A1O7_10118 [Cladophialophora yegresii CBS 114405]|uniref:Tat pathway signal sequence n=1 Tax=Cladophialophora yegresii CBS 114405 TaxID=1182544 RepID=W9VGL8_9EURO|nr:uncharacterized protein A1O7_10118 [Cladophialophora yegresii CBS 114405]EXJ54777.1 hypothetical protein A1O7_10118 [Cladophialophora yegresii CBS 114405]
MSSTCGILAPRNSIPAAPLQKSIEYEVRTFTQGLWGDHSIYQGAPNETNTAAWKEISHLGIIKLDDSQISQLSQPTIRYNRDPRYSAGAIEMFHNLHCLHHLRMHVWAEQPEVFYGRDPTKDEAAAHIDHCIDHIRQALMCQGSTDIITFRKDHKDRTVPNFDGPHVCRKYEPIAQWARDHKAWNMTPEGDDDDEDGQSNEHEHGRGHEH